MSKDSNWKPASDVHFTHNGVTLPNMTLELQRKIADFDTTNTEGGGWEEFGVAEKTTAVQGEVPIDDDDQKYPELGDLLAGSFTDGNKTYSGNVRLLEVSTSGGGKGGMKVKYSGRFTGAVTIA